MSNTHLVSTKAGTVQPWYPNKRTPSFPDALAELRTTLWRQRINAISGQQQLTPQIVDTLIDTLARAA